MHPNPVSPDAVLEPPFFVRAVSFDEFVMVGIGLVAPLHNGMPWSFEYEGHAVTHENDDCYLIASNKGTRRFNRGDILITSTTGEVVPISWRALLANYG